MEGIPLKECTYACDSDELELIEVKKDPPSISGRSLEVVIEDWLLKCAKCKKDFTIRQRVRYVDGERVDTMVSILDDRGNDLGWIGSY